MNEDARSVLSEYVAAKTPSGAKQGAAWDAINERIAGGDQGPNLPEDPVAGSGSSGLVLKGLVAGVVAAGVLYGVSQMGGAPTEPEPAAEAPVIEGEIDEEVEASAGLAVEVEAETPKAVAPEPATLVAEPETSEPDVKAQKKPKSDRKRAAAAPAVTEPDRGSASTLAAEMALLSKGQRALKRGDAKAALGYFDQHAREYAEGELADERRVQRAEALCALGRDDEARGEAQRFVKQRPNSPLRGKASRICVEDGP